MRLSTAFGYAVTALMYFGAWLVPQASVSGKLIRWVAFDKLCLTEFLSCHAVTLLAGTAMAMQLEGGSKEFQRIYWGLIVFYFIMGSAAYLLHRDHGALLGFYGILLTRAVGVLTLRGAEEDVLRAEVLKNMVMFFPMMLLLAGIAFGGGEESPEAFIQSRAGFAEKISQGRALLFVTGYYLLWAFVAWKWPERIAK